MDELITELTGVRFWVAVVFAGLIINLASSYLRPLVDRSISSISDNYQNKSEAKLAEETELFSELMDCFEFRNIHRQEAIFQRTRSVWFACLGVGLFVGALILQIIDIEAMKVIAVSMLISGTFSFSISMKYVSSSSKKWGRSIAAYSANKQRQQDA
jgi:hypothetical protein